MRGPEKFMNLVHVRFRDSEKKVLDEKCDLLHLSHSEVLRRAFWFWIDNEGKKHPNYYSSENVDGTP